MDVVSRRIFLTDLVKMDFPQSVLEEVKSTLSLMQLDFDYDWFGRVFRDVVLLFNGNYPGFRRCSTRYHDLKHTTDVLLAMTRLLHGAISAGEVIAGEQVMLGLMGALFHDTGFLQRDGDEEGTGAKYTMVHVDRAIEFAAEYFDRNALDAGSLAFCQEIIRCTDRDENRECRCSSRASELVGKLLGTADLLGQVADRTYLEKLLLLFQEFSEVQMPGCASELELLVNTLDFYAEAQYRMETELGDVRRYMVRHFRERWAIDADLYQESIESNIAYLRYLLEHHRHDYRDRLRRGGIVKSIPPQEC